MSGKERIEHGSIWLDKFSGYTVGVLMVCAHDHDCDNDRTPIVSGTWHKGPIGVDSNGFAFPEPEFRARFILLAEDPEAVEHRLRSAPAPSSYNIELGDPEPGWGMARDQHGVAWITYDGTAALNFDAALKKAADPPPSPRQEAGSG